MSITTNKLNKEIKNYNTYQISGPIKYLGWDAVYVVALKGLKMTTTSGNLTLKNRITSLEGRMSSLEIRVANLEVRMDKVEEHLTIIEERLTKVENRLENLERAFEKFAITILDSIESLHNEMLDGFRRLGLNK